MRVFIVRHGESQGNLAGTLQGSRVDEPLSPRGVQQAEALATRLAGEPLDKVFSSPMVRARQTALILAAPHGLDIELDPNLVEFDWGVWCGQPLNESLEKEVAAIRARWRAGEVDIAPDGGESPLGVQARAGRFLDRLRAHGPASTLVVAHGRFDRILMATLLHRPLWRMDEIRQRNGSVSTFEWNGHDAATPVLLDDVGHLSARIQSQAGGSDSLK